MTRFDKIAVVAIYAAMMLGFAWVVGLVVPGAVVRLQTSVGGFWSGVMIFSVIPICYGLAYYFARKESGKSLDP